MSWTADNIYTIPNKDLIQEIKENKDFLNEYGIYHINDFRGITSEWSKNFMIFDKNKDFRHLKHNLPENGILAIIPKEYKTGYDNDYSKYEFWNNFDFKTKSDKKLVTIIEKLKDEIDFEIGENQIKIFHFLQNLYNKHNCPIIYYRSDYWGGSVEFEFSIEFNVKNILYIHDNEKSIEFKDSKLSKSDKTVLQNSLKSINLELPTDFFALHERGFDWSKYEI